MRRDLLHAAVLIGVLSVSGAVSAQTTIISGTGSIFRYHGDTIRLERDTTVTITIYRGDTVLTSSSVNGALRYEVSYVVRGDSAWVIDVRTANGATLPGTAIGTAAPTQSILMTQTMLEAEIRTAAMRARLLSMSEFEPQALPEPARVYEVSPTVWITQHRDTVWFQRGCRGASRIDTTVFLMFAEDSVKRISQPARMFGKAMNLSLTAHMRSAMMRERLRERETSLPADLPRAPRLCP